MKLYYKPGACSLAAHIVVNEAGLPVSLEQVDLANKKTADGGDYFAVSPNGYVPALAIADGDVLTEASVVVQYLADKQPQSGLMPAAGSIERYKAQQWLAFISTELHKNFGVFFKPDSTDAMKSNNKALLEKRLAYVDGQIADKTYLLGDIFSAADAYLYTVLRWAGFTGVTLPANVSRWFAAVSARPAVQKALSEEGLA
ncbi:glutathione transferase GstA [Paradevosia shaoguanensis]|jgi:glutathione S-transferase|uniref:glutathione transferase GstA n=1 Tax=Paradevosia shaoguanensis TaxID=1335043 RepID=UPI0005065187|nr:glutathione S-transferase [Devosia sp. 17-2-E-8]QMV01972.1 glutathione transferase GstA [Devosia sp. D6-9]